MNGSVNLVLGLVIVLFRGMLTASFAARMKLSRRWSWENTWLVYAMFAFVALTIPHSLAFLGSIPLRVMLPALLFGFTWGVAQVTFGLSIARVGIAMAFAIVGSSVKGGVKGYQWGGAKGSQ